MTDEKKSVMMVIPRMVGGGAERVAAMLLNEFHDHGYQTSFLLTHSSREEVINRDLKPGIPLLFLQEKCTEKKSAFKCRVASLLSHIFEDTGHAVPAAIARFSFMAQYGPEIAAFRKVLQENPEMTAVVFSQPAIPIALLAAENLPNRIVISERTDPNRLMKKRYGYKFIEKYYMRADAAVFQTEDAKNTYPECVRSKGTVIFNPIKSDLPEAYSGKRNKNITTFCRISAQKNLPLLFAAFRMLHEEYPEYKLRVIGGTNNEDDAKIEAGLRRFVKEHQLEASVIFEPFNPDVHGSILKDAMYVNSSDFEGISNSMLEAMAIGLPVVCTDCPVGGARAAIKDGENGLLVPVGNSKALYEAMKKVIENPALAEKLSRNGIAFTQNLSLEKIAGKWMELL